MEQKKQELLAHLWPDEFAYGKYGFRFRWAGYWHEWYEGSEADELKVLDSVKAVVRNEGWSLDISFHAKFEEWSAKVSVEEWGHYCSAPIKGVTELGAIVDVATKAKQHINQSLRKKVKSYSFTLDERSYKSIEELGIPKDERLEVTLVNPETGEHRVVLIPRVNISDNKE